MLNFGICELRVVAPHCAEWRLHQEAISRSCGALSVLEQAHEYEDMQSATADLQLVIASTARPRDASKVRLPVIDPREAAERALASASTKGERVAFLFGSEKNGLTTDELSHAHAIVTIGTEPLFSSLNLAQAVLLLAYEWRSAAQKHVEGPAPVVGSPERPAEAAATLQQTRELMDFWESALWRAHFFRGSRDDAQESARAAGVMGKLRSLVMRSQPTAGDASLLRGALQVLAEPKAPPAK